MTVTRRGAALQADPLVGEVVADLTREQGQELTAEIRGKLEGYSELGVQIATAARKAFDGRAWAALGYETWDAYCQAEFRSLPLARRVQESVNSALLIEGGMSSRSAAAVSGTDHKTSSADARRRAGGESSPPGSAGRGKPSGEVTGADGKKYSRTRKEPANSPSPKPQPRPGSDPPVSLMIRFRNARKLLQGIAGDLAEHGIPAGDPPRVLLSETSSSHKALDMIESAIGRPDGTTVALEQLAGPQQSVSRPEDARALRLVPD